MMDFVAPNDEPEQERFEQIEASLTATEFFRSLEQCDSRRVDDFWCILEDTVLEIMNWNGRRKNK